MDYDDSSYQADVSFHFDDIEGITSESGLALYTRSSAGSGWSEVAGWTLNNEGDNADGEGYITANDLTGFSQFIIVDDGDAVNPLPEPSTLVLLGAGMIIFCSYFIFRRRTVKNTGHL